MGGNIESRIGPRAMFGKDADLSFNSTPGSAPEGLFSIARVTFVLLDDSNKEKFNQLGGWKNIGAIECQTFINSNQGSTSTIIAYPSSQNITHFPLEEELIMLVKGVDYTAQDPLGNYKSKYYYTSLINGWNGVEDNTIPNSLKIKDKGVDKINGLFNSTGKVQRRIKAPGDITVEGRTGSIIRLGSSIKGFNSPFSGPDRSPMLLISNKQNENVDHKTAGFEDINKDGSSFYMLNGHDVNFILSSVNFDSYNEKVNNSPKNNYVVPIQSDPIENNTPLAKADDVKVVDSAPTPLPVSSATPPQTKTLEESDKESLPAGETENYFKEDIQEYVFTEDAIQYQNAVFSSNEFEKNALPAPSPEASLSSVNSKIFKSKAYNDFIASPGVVDALNRCASNIKVNVNDLLLIIYAESAGSFSPSKRNKFTNATGLIQFMPKTANLLRTDIDTLARMTPAQQLYYVELYYKDMAGKYKNVYDLYLKTFAPIGLGKPDNWIFQWKNVSAQLISNQNPAIAKAAGKAPGTPLTIADFKIYVTKLINSK